MRPETLTISDLLAARRISDQQIESAINAALGGWARRPFPFNDRYTIDLNWLLTVEANACSVMASDKATDDEKRSIVRAAIMQAVPARMPS